MGLGVQPIDATHAVKLITSPESTGLPSSPPVNLLAHYVKTVFEILNIILIGVMRTDLSMSLNCSPDITLEING